MEKKTSFGIALMTFITVLALSWGFTCGVLYLASLCFNVVYYLKTATGVWLLLVLLRVFFRSSGNTKK